LKSFNELIALCLAKSNEPKIIVKCKIKDLVVRGRPMVILFFFKKQLAQSAGERRKQQK
jgi:hypothetical protein